MLTILPGFRENWIFSNIVNFIHRDAAAPVVFLLVLPTFAISEKGGYAHLDLCKPVVNYYMTCIFPLPSIIVAAKLRSVKHKGVGAGCAVMILEPSK